MSYTKDVDELRKRTKGGKTARRKLSTMAKSVLIFGIGAVVLAGVLLVPTPKDGKNSGIELYGEDREAEVYGPELPQSTVGSYPKPVVDSPFIDDSDEEVEETVYVYASDDQDCYHLSTCKFAYASGHRFTVHEAKLLGYKPCGRCNPPPE